MLFENKYKSLRLSREQNNAFPVNSVKWSIDLVDLKSTRISVTVTRRRLPPSAGFYMAQLLQKER